MEKNNRNCVVIIRINDDNYATKDCFIADNLKSAQEFICKDAEIEIDELEDYKDYAISKNCIVYNIDDGLIYRIHLKPEFV